MSGYDAETMKRISRSSKTCGRHSPAMQDVHVPWHANCSLRNTSSLTVTGCDPGLRIQHSGTRCMWTVALRGLLINSGKARLKAPKSLRHPMPCGGPWLHRVSELLQFGHNLRSQAATVVETCFTLGRYVNTFRFVSHRGSKNILAVPKFEAMQHETMREKEDDWFKSEWIRVAGGIQNRLQEMKLPIFHEKPRGNLPSPIANHPFVGGADYCREIKLDGKLLFYFFEVVQLSTWLAAFSLCAAQTPTTRKIQAWFKPWKIWVLACFSMF